MKIDELIEKNLIRKEKIGKEEIFGSLELAKRFLERAEGNFKIGFWDVAFLLAYSSMFHSTRILLFKNGYKERSHWAMIVVLKDIYKENEKIQKILDIIDSYRISRHAIQYRGSLCSRIDAEEAIKDAKEFIEIVKEIIKELK
jgi:uncharacterized protein (UPF0332 family)